MLPPNNMQIILLYLKNFSQRQLTMLTVQIIQAGCIDEKFCVAPRHWLSWHTHWTSFCFSFWPRKICASVQGSGYSYDIMSHCYRSVVMMILTDPRKGIWHQELSKCLSWGQSGSSWLLKWCLSSALVVEAYILYSKVWNEAFFFRMHHILRTFIIIIIMHPSYDQSRTLSSL